MLKRNLIHLCLALTIASALKAQSLQMQLILPAIDLGCIDDLTLIPKPDPSAVKATSTCTRAPITIRHIDDILVNRDCESIVQRIYEAKDLCGRSVRDTQEILFVYDTFPKSGNELIVYVDLGCNPDLLNSIPDPDHFDLPICDAKFKWLGDERDQKGCYRELTRKYQVTSCRGSWTYILIYNWIEDLEPPKIICPESVHFGCNYTGIPAPDPSQLRVEDNCCLDTVFWATDIIVSAFDTCEHTLIRRYWAIDCCGNASYCDQIFNWYSFPHPPVIVSCPEGGKLGCNIDLTTDLPAATPELVEVEETCGKITVDAHLSDITVVGCEYSISWVYVVTDECGNSAQCLQTYSWIVDTEIPFINHCPADLDLGCNPENREPGLVSPDFGIKAYDNCGIKSIKRLSTSDIKDGEHCEKYYYITYAVEDHCGNIATCDQKVYWTEDKEAPTIACPPDLDLGCNPAFIPAADPSLIRAEDNCCLKEVTWLLDVIVENPDGCDQTRIRKYQAIDCCGNSSICEQKISWTSDVTPPVVISCPEGKYLGCNFDWQNDLPPATPELVIAEDKCGEVEITAALSDVTVFECEFSISWVYIIKDRCGNIEQCLQTYTWTVDNTPPEIRHCPADLDLGCNPVERDPYFTSPDFGIEATDNCGIESIKKVSTSAVQDGADCTKFYHITYQVSDFCGNISTCTQRVFWREDITPPSIICPPDLHLGCSPEEVPAPDPSLVQAFDNCGIASVAMTASSISNDLGVITITRTYTAIDHCGNKASCDQTITYHETGIQIYVICPEDVDYGCVAEMPAIPDPDPDESSDGPCVISKIYAGDDLQQITPCEYVWTRTYLFITCCDDTITCFQTFRWRIVNSDSIIDIPEDITAFCSIPPLPDFVNQGLCGPGIPIFTGQDVIGDCEDGNCTIKRYWKKQGCQGGWTITDVQTIEVKCDLTLELKSESETPKRSMELQLYPNPATEWLTLDLVRHLEVTSITIVDSQGRIAKHVPLKTSTDKVEIEIGDLTAGIYQLVLKGAETISERFIKM